MTGATFLDVVWTGTHFVASGGEGFYLDSTDGVAWHSQPGVARGCGSVLATGTGGVISVGTKASCLSRDGLAWTAHPVAFPMPAAGTSSIEVTDVVARGDGWLAVGRRDPDCQIDCGVDPTRSYVWTSNDGTKWTRLADQAALKGGGMDAVARRDDGFVAVGISAMHSAIWTSPDGLVWSRVPDAQTFREPGSSYGWALEANGVAVQDGNIVVVGTASGQDTCPPGAAVRLCPGLRAWWSADGRTWSKATVDKAKDVQGSSVAATPAGFLATGWGTDWASGIWASSDGHAWRCDASGDAFKGFEATAVAASDTVEVTTGLLHVANDGSKISGAV